jgi:hypothetical protein
MQVKVFGFDGYRPFNEVVVLASAAAVPADSDFVVEGDAFGRQFDRFEEDLRVAGIAEEGQKPFPGIFIRVSRLIARLADGTAVAAREGRLLATSFHPELSRGPRLHAYFLELTHGVTRHFAFNSLSSRLKH